MTSADVDSRTTITVAVTSVVSLLLSECKSLFHLITNQPRIFTPFHLFSFDSHQSVLKIFNTLCRIAHSFGLAKSDRAFLTLAISF